MLLLIPTSLGMYTSSTKPGKAISFRAYFLVFGYTEADPRQGVNFAHFVRAIVQFAMPPSHRTVPPTRNQLRGNLTMTKILTSLLIAAVMSCSVGFAQDNFGASKEDGQKRVEFALYGKFGCVLVDGKVFCARGVKRAPIKLGAPVSN